jgi:hypothetical protein
MQGCGSVPEVKEILSVPEIHFTGITSESLKPYFIFMVASS